VYGYFNYLAPLTEGVASPPSPDQYHSWFTVNRTIPEIFRSWFRTGRNEAFDSSLLSLPLFELTSRIAQNFGLNKIKGELIYLESFLDLVLLYGRDEAGGAAGFLDWWQTTGSTKTITLSEGQNAISILTIHKSKGLEFHTVFVPLCDWEIVPLPTKAPYLWCHPVQAPFDKMDLVLVRYGSALQRTIFSDEYYKEMLYSSVDNLNLLYVALTRAVNSLIIFCPYTAKLSNSYKSINSLIQGVIENPPLLDSIDREKYIDLTEFWNPETKILEIGEIKKVLYTAKTEVSDNRELDGLILAGNSNRLKLRIHSDSYFDLYDNLKSERIGHGKLMHELFEKIATISDVSPSIKRMVSEGKIDTATGVEYEKLIFSLMEEEPFRSWFNGDWKILNERNILRGDEKRHRPDRIMIKGEELVVVDYKTGTKSDHDFAQVRGYISDFNEMGYEKSKGYLWYLSNNEIVEVINN